jgi:hypothetical protein
MQSHVAIISPNSWAFFGVIISSPQAARVAEGIGALYGSQKPPSHLPKQFAWKNFVPTRLLCDDIQAVSIWRRAECSRRDRWGAQRARRPDTCGQRSLVCHVGFAGVEATATGGYVVRDANGQALAYLYSRDNEAEARQAKVLTKDEAPRIAVNVARLPELLGKAEPD